MTPTSLHGNLHVTIYEVDLPGSDSNCLSEVLNLSSKGVASLYVTIALENTVVGKTRVRPNPRWFESFQLYCAHMTSHIVCTLKNDNTFGATIIGKTYFPARELLHGEKVDMWCELLAKDYKYFTRNCRIHFEIQYLEVGRDENWSRGIFESTFSGVPYTFHPQRNGCKVSLYQDAHIPDKFVPKIPLAGGKFYEPQRCWEDLFDVISNAQHFICIAGWSVYTEIKLVRDPLRSKPGGEMTLGELLKKKAREGVQVRMLVWDDRTSVRYLKKNGLMATHDEETRQYFQKTSVQCVLCPRKPDKGGSFVQSLKTAMMFTHHEKIIVADSSMPGGESEKRRIVSFIGGLDLADGRYDTPFHSLFETLNTTHSGDFYQKNFNCSSIERGGPREPWHDIHCQLEGPVAWDVLLNFEKRWNKQSGKDLLILIRDLKDKIIPQSTVMLLSDDTWNVQLFRSLDRGAASGFPDRLEDCARSGLMSWKNIVKDRSIQDAYINAIRRANNFIYIENQYFLGSSFSWRADGINPDDIEAFHLIPKEILLKITSKIAVKERFTAYIVIPMWPEGIPESDAVQTILDWQRRTMDMMYRDIVRALNDNGICEDPRNYLTFFCLGNRETKKPGEYIPAKEPDPKSNYSKAQRSRRFMIYVHSKMMIVDDEYIIVGSANINQRSMDGGKDSETAMGAFQPNHLSTTAPARGQIHGFRMALWSEHLGMHDDSFLKPESKACFDQVNRIARENWDLYYATELEHDLPSHLLPYPIQIAGDGEVKTISGLECFPDTEARILGSISKMLPSILTT